MFIPDPYSLSNSEDDEVEGEPISGKAATEQPAAQPTGHIEEGETNEPIVGEAASEEQLAAQSTGHIEEGETNEPIVGEPASEEQLAAQSTGHIEEGEMNEPIVGEPASEERQLTIEVFIRDNGLSYFAVLLSFLETLVGAGFLALPFAFKESGQLSGLIMFIVAAMLNCYAMKNLVECAQFIYITLKIPYISYGNLAKEACRASFPWLRPHGILAKRIVNASILVLEFGFCSTYYLFIATTLHKEFCVFNIEAWLGIIFIPITVLTIIRPLRVLSVFSLIGNVLMLVAMPFILYELIVKWQDIDHLKSWNSFDNLLTACGTIVFSLEAQTLVLQFEKKLKQPKQMLGFFGILFSGVFIATIIAGSVSFLGYVAYGDNVKGSIRQNLEKKELPIILVKAALCLCIFSAFFLQLNVMVEMTWSPVKRLIFVGNEDEKKQWQLPPSFSFACKLLFRVFMVAVCFSFAAAVPDLERLISLVGSTAGMMLAFVFPALIDLFTFVPVLLKEGQERKARLRLIATILLACVGLFGMLAGLKANISEMMTHKNTTSIAC